MSILLGLAEVIQIVICTYCIISYHMYLQVPRKVLLCSLIMYQDPISNTNARTSVLASAETITLTDTETP